MTYPWPKKVAFFGPPIYAFPKFWHFFGKVQNAFYQKNAKFRAGFRSLEPPCGKQDSPCKRRTGQISTNIAKKSTFFWQFVFVNLRAAGISDPNRNLEVIIPLFDW